MVLKITNLHILKYLPTCWLYLLECYTIDNQRCTHTASHPISDKGKELGHMVQQEAALIGQAMDELEAFRKSPDKLRAYCNQLHDIENRADDIYEFFITRLFEEEKDCIELIKIKEIMYELEKTTDAAEHVGKILRSLIVKYA